MMLDEQRALLTALYETHVGAGDAYALVDFPDHANVGDSAIWLGELALLRAITGRDPAYVCTWDRFDEAAFRHGCPTGTVFIHGGGNLGDIWRHHQQFRETILATIRDRRVVQLPQSIHFRDPANLVPFARLVAAHPDFHLCVRDAPSLAVAQAHLECPTTLAPDSAIALGPQLRSPADCEVLMLLRTDDEARAYDRTLLAAVPGAVVVDWLVDGPEATAAARVGRGLRLLSRGRQVVTDRLHGHILATLLGIPHVALDNDYGKVSAYIASWSPDAQTAASAEQAVALLR